ncbi:MAG: STAS domain-containing protein [Actinomycetota bacterium]|nr:STAS domain-containing protein [Actinomycetota bacterium]
MTTTATITTFPTAAGVHIRAVYGPDIDRTGAEAGARPSPAAPDVPAGVPADVPADLFGVSCWTAVSSYHPSADICVVAVDGEIDLLSAPLLDVALGEQLAGAPPHLIVDLQRVRFISARAMSSLLDARDLARRGGSTLHLSGLANRTVARPLQLCNLLGLFDAHPTLADALGTLGAASATVTTAPGMLGAA